VLNAVIHLQGSSVVLLPAADAEAGEEVPEGPGPIVPEAKELYWGAGAFIVFALLMRLFLVPKVRKGMESRYNGIRSAHDAADQERAAARAEVAEYESQIAAIKAEAATRLEAARQTLEAERQVQLDAVNGRIAVARAEAAEQTAALRASVQGEIKSAVSDVAGRAGELATGRRPSADVVARVVDEVMAR
jgi:F-type H+-transporting ATPase subunit b